MKKQRKNNFRNPNEQIFIEDEVGKLGHHIFYNRLCMLPALELQVLMKERGREEMNDLDLTILRLIDQGISSVQTLSLLTGLAERTIFNLLHEKEGESLIEWNGASVIISPLGKECLKTGYPLRIIKKSLRYCPLSSQLLPREAYNLDFSPATSMGKNELNFKDIIGEPELVQLKGLDIENLSDKYAYNIFDEAVSIDKLLSYESGYIEATLSLSGKTEPTTAWVQWKERFLEYDINLIKPVREIFDPKASPKSNKQKGTFEEIILDSLKNDGALASSVSLDSFGLPIVTINEVTEEWLKSRMGHQKPWVLMCGTGKIPARPVFRYPFADIMQGNSLRFYICNEELECEIELIRELSDALDQLKRSVKDRKPLSLYRHMKDKYGLESMEEIKPLADKYRLNNLKKILEAADS